MSRRAARTKIGMYLCMHNKHVSAFSNALVVTCHEDRPKIWRKTVVEPFYKTASLLRYREFVDFKGGTKLRVYSMSSYSLGRVISSTLIRINDPKSILNILQIIRSKLSKPNFQNTALLLIYRCIFL